ncbi:hypothetical protein J4234_03285 [Candidatus Woesearchaeota archaeon]|nr:hypothetical protein [Candidatus Woesearchaeota archaeon]
MEYLTKTNDFAIVGELMKSSGRYYECEECKFVYKDRRTAKECENYCKKYHSCNMEITKLAVKL